MLEVIGIAALPFPFVEADVVAAIMKGCTAPETFLPCIYASCCVRPLLMRDRLLMRRLEEN